MTTQEQSSQENQSGSKYLDRIQQSKEAKDAQQSQFQAEEAEQSLASDILATKRSIVAAKQDVMMMKGRYPLDAKGIIDKQLVVEGYEEGLKRLEALKAELF